MNKKIIPFFILCMIFLPVFSWQGYCQDSADMPCTKILKGSVNSIDWVGNKLAVRTTYYGHPDEVTVIVSGDTAFVKGTDNISFADINIGDSVEVEYYCNTFAGLRSRVITVNE